MCGKFVATIVHGLWRCVSFWIPVYASCRQKIIMKFINDSACRSQWPLFTGVQKWCLCSWNMFTGVQNYAVSTTHEHECQFGHLCSQAMDTAREHGYCVPTISLTVRKWKSKQPCNLNFVASEIIMYCWLTLKLTISRIYSESLPKFNQLFFGAQSVIFQFSWKSTHSFLSCYQTDKQSVAKTELTPKIAALMMLH